MALIALIQFGALVYGGYVIFVARPVYTIFHGDRFEVVSANEYDETELKKNPVNSYTQFSLTGPRWVGAVMPETDVKEKQRILFSALAGGGLRTMPQYYVPFDQIKVEAIRNGRLASELISPDTLSLEAARIKSTSALSKTRVSADQIESLKAWVAQLSAPIEKVVLLPIKSSGKFGVVALHNDTGALLGAKAIDPWWYQ